MARKIKTEVNPEEQKPPAKPVIDRVHKFLGLIFYLIWIPVGLVFLLSVYANFRQGAYSGLFDTSGSLQNQQAAAPAEADLPGVGLVNVSCVQNALSTDSIQKIAVEGNTNSLSDEEKAKLEPCIVSSASPSPTS